VFRWVYEFPLLVFFVHNVLQRHAWDVNRLAEVYEARARALAPQKFSGKLLVGRFIQD
jgi:hypothetical protein